MPLLNGKSSHGSKPMTSLPFTFNWMPHCCPQKQQWVLTSLSGSTEASTRWPPWYARCGPNFASNSGVTVASAAIAPSLGRRGDIPQMPLRQGKHLTPASRADVLVVAGGVSGPLVVVAELARNDDQVIDVDLRCENRPAAGASCLFTLPTDIGVELDRQLRRPLEDVEELAERKP